jgi:peroxiredoxin
VEFLRDNPNSLVAVYALYRDYSYRMSSGDIKKNLALLNPGLLRTPYAEILQKLISTREVVSIGKPAPDFTVPGMDGTPVTLSKMIKGHKYLLLDFWASWCGPCRHENPNIVRAYRKFHDKGFDILSVSLDRNREAWITAAKKDGLIWHHASELKYWNSAAATLYGIRSIPANVLIDANGIIVGRNLRGDDLQVTLEGLLK